MRKVIDVHFKIKELEWERISENFWFCHMGLGIRGTIKQINEDLYHYSIFNESHLDLSSGYAPILVGAKMELNADWEDILVDHVLDKIIITEKAWQTI